MKSGLKPSRDFASFSPAKELKRSESEEAGVSKEQESSGSEQGESWEEQQSLAENSQDESDLQDQVDSSERKGGDEDYETPESHHFRGSSFGNESDQEDTPGSNFERLVTSYEKSLERQQTLDQQMKDLHQAHSAQQDIWESRYKRASLDLERLTQRNEELLELLNAKEAELSRLREDVETLRREARESRAAESRTKDVIRKLEEELAFKDQAVKAQNAKVEELVKYFNKEKKGCRTPTRSPAPAQPRDGSPCFSLRTNSRFNGVYLLQGARREEDKGKQEMRMPFLSHSTDNWISSLRSARNPARGSSTPKPKASTETSKESIAEFTQKEGEELPNFAFFLNKF